MNLNDLATLQTSMRESDKLVVINKLFPQRLTSEIQSLIEYRVKLISKYPIKLKGGDSLLVETNCLIEEDATACMYVKSNPNVPLQCEERYVKCETQKLSLRVFNFNDNVIHIPKHACIAYLIISF